MEKNIILEHELVPKHEIMKQAEVKEMLEKYGITKNLLPRITEGDPIAEAIGAKKKDVLRIVRRSKTAGEAIYYRIVV